ncbi:MAG TPA: hypothetical protein VK281_12035, partial [Xanthobacteraceae bacterium]|nr:hypothetical protein [Xanthobacteraceae bacterium]
MSSLDERTAGHNVTSHRHRGEPCRSRRNAGLCVAVGIWLVALAAEGPMHVLAGAADQRTEVRAQDATAPVLFVVPKIEIEPDTQSKLFWFVLTGGEEVAPGTHVLIRGLSTGVSFTSGQADADGGWVVSLAELEELEIKVPRSLSGNLNLDAALVDGNGAVLDEHPVELVVKPAAVAEPNVATIDPPPKYEAIATGAVPSRAAKPDQVTASPIDVKAEAAIRPAKSQPTDGAPAVAAAPPPQAEPAGAAAPTRTGTDVAPPLETAITTAPPPPVAAAPSGPGADAVPPREGTVAAAPPLQIEPAGAAAPTRTETEAAPPQEAVITTAPPQAVKPVAAAAPSRPQANAAPPREAVAAAPPPPVTPTAGPAPSRPEPDAARQPAAVVAALPPVGPAAPALVVAPALDAEAAAATRFAVSVSGRPEDLPPGTVVRVSGLRGGVTLSGGRANSDHGWVVPLWALDDLRIRVPSDTSGNLALVVALVGNDGAALAERSVALRITPRFAAAPRDLALPQERTVAAPALAQATLLAEQGDRSLAQGHVAEAREHFTRAIDLVVSQFQRPT